MALLRSQYLIVNPGDLADLANQLNRVLGLLADRLDRIEGYRGSPAIESDLDLKGNRIINLGSGVEGTDAATKTQVSGSAIDHGTLIGLGDDDHTQYAKLGGRSGGQTLKGGTADGDNLTIQSTAHANRGYIDCKDGLHITDTFNVLIHGFIKL